MNGKKPRRYGKVNKYTIISKIYDIISDLYELQAMLLDYFNLESRYTSIKKESYKIKTESKEQQEQSNEKSDDLYDKLLFEVEKRTAFPKEIIHEKVKKKIKEYHGLITKIGALKLVLKDLGKEEIIKELFGQGS